MIIFSRNYELYCYIHIPKNSGTYFRDQLQKDEECIIIENFWGKKCFFDLAHIPYMLVTRYTSHVNYNNTTYLAHLRNPYDRVISAFFYHFPKKTTNDFKLFVKTELVKLVFDMKFNRNIIHYYPQYFFVCDKYLKIPTNIKTHKVEDTFPNFKKYELFKYYDTSSLQIINKIYHLDFELFNYKKLKTILRV